MNPNIRSIKLVLLAVCTLLASSRAQIDVARTTRGAYKFRRSEMRHHIVSTMMNEEIEAKSPFLNTPFEPMEQIGNQNHQPYCIYPPPTPKPPSPMPPQTSMPTPPLLRPPTPYTKPEHGVWCVAKPTVPVSLIQVAMDYACASGADCAPIRLNGLCYQPDTVLAHASYAFNSYWQRTKQAGGTCDFGGLAMFVTVDPSYDQCHFVYS